MAVRAETELYEPVKAFFEERGYMIRGEVRHCDVVAMKEGQPPVIIELKRSFTIPLLLQGIERQRISRFVYAAIELPNKGRAPQGATWPEIRRLCGMLGLGLLTVRFYKTRKPRVQAECHPPGMELSIDADLMQGSPLHLPAQTPFDADLPDAEPEAFYEQRAKARPRHNRRAAEKIVREFQERSADYNTGGSTKRKLVTAYREQALYISWLMKQAGQASPRQLKKLTGNPRTAGILQRNVYRWFTRVERGLYQLTPQGEAALSEYAMVVQAFQTSAGEEQTGQ